MHRSCCRSFQPRNQFIAYDVRISIHSILKEQDEISFKICNVTVFSENQITNIDDAQLIMHT